jgi:hypothetical protein
MTARIFNMLTGTWLFLSAFAWQHTPVQGMTALICGTLTVLTALGAIYFPRLRYLTALVAIVLFVASLAVASPYDMTFWHNAVMAIAIFVAALADPAARRERDTADELKHPVSTH